MTGSHTRRTFSFQVARTFIARLLAAISSLLTGVIVARWLGADDLGVLAVINVAVAIAVQVGSAGLPGANIYFVGRERRALVPAAINALLFALVAGSALACALTFLASDAPGLLTNIPPPLVALAAVSIPFQLVTLLGINLLLVIGQVGRFNLLETAGQLFAVVNAGLALIALGAGLPTLLLLNTAASIVVSVATVLLIYRYVSRQSEQVTWRADTALLGRMMRYGVKFQLLSLAIMLIYRADLLILNYFRSGTEVGIYSVASQMALLMLLPPGVIAHLLFSQVASADDARGEFTCAVTRHTTLIMLIACCLSAPVSFILPMLYGAEFADAPVQFLLLLPGVFLLSLESVVLPYFIGTGLPARIVSYWATTAAVNIALNLLFVPVFGARGAAVISSATYALIFALIYARFRARTGNNIRQTFVLSGMEWQRLRHMISSKHSLRQAKIVL